LDPEWIEEVRVDEGEVAAALAAARANSLPEERETPEVPPPSGGKARTVQPTAGIRDRAAWLLRAVACIDLTTLSGDDTPSRVRRLCAEARTPVASSLLRAVGAGDRLLTTAAVCVYHEMAEIALEALEGSRIPVAAVSAGFPHGLSALSARLTEIEASVAIGVQEIDAVFPRFLVLEGDWSRLYEEVRAYRQACGGAHLKMILSTGELGSLANVEKASLVCMMAGADFIKTSTGKEKVNATLPAGFVMARAIREYARRTGYEVGLKPAGGIRTTEEALEWLTLARNELGERWTGPSLFRFGASSLLDDLRRELERLAKERT